MMRRPADTSDDMRDRQLAAYRAMTPATRLRLSDQMSTDVRELARAGERTRTPQDPAPDAKRDASVGP